MVGCSLASVCKDWSSWSSWRDDAVVRLQSVFEVLRLLLTDSFRERQGQTQVRKRCVALSHLHLLLEAMNAQSLKDTTIEHIATVVKDTLTSEQTRPVCSQQSAE